MSEYIAGLTHARDMLDRELQRAKTELADIEVGSLAIDLDEPEVGSLEFDILQHEKVVLALEDVGITAVDEHTGGGVMVVYVRDMLVGMPLHPEARGDSNDRAHIGITPVEEDGSRDFLVIGYLHYSDDVWSQAHMWSGPLVGVPEAVDRIANEISVELVALAEGASRGWVHGVLVEGTQLGNPGDTAIDPSNEWTARLMARGHLEHLEYGGGRSRSILRPQIVELAPNDGIGTNPEYLVYWVDEIGLNDWLEWVETYDQAIEYLARLQIAVMRDTHIDEVWLEVHSEPPRT